MNTTTRRACTALALCIASMAAAWADEGHSHDHGPAAAVGQASPRFEAHSDLFELVGVLDKGQLTVYLDRYATNEPVTNAKIEFESGSEKGVASPQADGTYALKLAGLDKPGHFPLAFTVTAGPDTDLLAGELEVAAPAAAGDAAQARPWLWWGGGGAAAIAAAVAAVLFVRRRPGRRPGLRGAP